MIGQKQNNYYWLLMLWLAGVQPSLAVLLQPLTIEQLARKAHVVVRGTLQEQSFHRDAAGRPYTKIGLDIVELWKGDAPDRRITIVFAGDPGKKSPLMEEYHPGEDVVAFLVWNQRREGVTVGLAQGKFRVLDDPSTHEKIATNIFSSTAASLGAVQKQGRSSARALRLSELKKRVFAALP